MYDLNYERMHSFLKKNEYLGTSSVDFIEDLILRDNEINKAEQGSGFEPTTSPVLSPEACTLLPCHNL